ncbi:MAG: molybdopterin biosynthesis protein [candidate division WOR-3 bacterium]
MKKKYFLERTEPERAKEIISETLRALLNPETLGTEVVEIHKASGRILSESIRAIYPVPREYLSAMDGVATKAEFTFGASPSNPVMLKEEQYKKINTGNLLPPEYDCVIRREDYTETDQGTLIIIKPHHKYQNVRVPGEDILPYDLILEKFRPVDGKTVALALQSGIKNVTVLSRINAVFIPTGNELLRLGEEYQKGKVFETNSYIFKHELEKLGIEVIVNDIVPDDPERIEKYLYDLARRFHLIFICGGTSAGEFDYTAEILKKHGKLLIHGLNLRPGKPFVFGIFNNRPVFGLPGYPGAALFDFEYVVLPAVMDFLGITEGTGEVKAFAGKKIVSSEGEVHLINVVISKVGKNYWFYPVKQGSGPLSPFINRNGYTVVDKGVEGVEEMEEKLIHLSTRKDLVDRSLLFVGSHDLSMDIIKEILWSEYRILLNIVNVGSLGGIQAILKGRTHLSAIHLLDEESGDYNTTFVKKYELKDFYLFPFLEREQGFVLRKGHEEVKTFREIAEKGYTFVSRQRGSGTRILTDFLLKKEGLNPINIKGYQNEVTTHIEVAHYVKEGLADVGVAVYPVAQLFDLKFIPIGFEEYDLLLPGYFVKGEYFEKIIKAIKSTEFLERIEKLGGYRIVFKECPKLEG